MGRNSSRLLAVLNSNHFSMAARMPKSLSIDDFQESMDSNNGQGNSHSNELESNIHPQIDMRNQESEPSEVQHMESPAPAETTTPIPQLSNALNTDKGLEVEWNKQDEKEDIVDNNGDGGIHITMPHHYPSISFPHDIMKSKREKTFNLSKPVTRIFSNAAKEEDIDKSEEEPVERHNNNHSIPDELFYPTTNPAMNDVQPEIWTENHRKKSDFNVNFNNEQMRDEQVHKEQSSKKPSDDIYKERRHEEQKGKGLLKRLLDDEPYSTIPPFTICPYLGLRKSQTNTTLDVASLVKCNPKKANEISCKEAYIAYEVDVQPLQCNHLQGVNEICSFDEYGRVHCNMSLCGESYVHVASVDPDYGIVRGADSIFIGSDKELENLLYDYSRMNKENGFNFCFLKCKSRSKVHPHIEQLVVFPPIIRSAPALDPPLININILLLDSVSRPHFYRTLQKTVQTLRTIVHDPNLNATVLDYELFQSMADYTFHNVRVFMSGKTDFHYKEHQDQHYEIEYMFKRMKSKGYHTLLQEDSCWFDEWGSLYTDNLYQGKKPENLKDFKSRWHAFKENVKSYYIDDYGLSHFSCEALQRYNITNQFNQPRKICFGGKVFAEYFLDYIDQVFTQNEHSKTPILAYTHLNTGHEVSGTRIKQLDQKLSEFFLSMAKKDNTLTLVFSDHGPKTTQYAFRTMNGRAEIYDSLMFAIVPEKVASFLGYERTKALITNQKRLMTALELHNTLLSIADPNRASSGSFSLEGIFAEISPNRTCSDISMKSAAICKCDGWDITFATNHPPFIWLAELALGTLNNRIQDEYMQGMVGMGGFGKCQRLIGKRFEKIRRRSVGNTSMVTMDLIVQPDSEIFEFEYRVIVTTYFKRNM
ncbi:hypothetical protein QZH41_004638 [Actinostola sp. cb2023]|nr:hypothetical protein QZH41_004638 [Actinostola sp. cb2023]